MKISFKLNDEVKTIKSNSFFPMTVPVGTEINVIEGNLKIIEIDCSKDEALAEVTRFCVMGDERFELFYNNLVHDINEYDKKTKSSLDRYLIVLSNVKNISEELENRIQALWNKTRAAGIYHVFKVVNKEDLWERIRSSNQNIF